MVDMTIEELDLSVRAFNCLKRAGINTVSELVQKDQEEMMKVRNLGRRALKRSSRSSSCWACLCANLKNKPLPTRAKEEYPHGCTT